MGILIKNGEIITASDRFVADVYCDGGRIVAVAPGLEKLRADDTVIDASGQIVLPGGVDAHVHMELPFMGTESSDDFETGTAAGVAGGTTTIIDFVIPARGQHLLDGYAMWMEKAKKSVADYAFHMAVTWFSDRTISEMETCVREHGITSFKTFMAYRGAIGIEDPELIQVMDKSAAMGSLVTVHCEHGDAVVALQKKFLREGKTDPKYHALSRPAPVEGEATARAIMLARMMGNPVYIVHVTCKEAVDAIVEARTRGQVVMAETCPQYLLLDDSVYEKPDFEGAAYVMSPPIRPKGHQDALWSALAAGHIQTVATDHCPFNQVGQKEMGRNNFSRIPNGAAGIENRLGLLWTAGVVEGRFDAHKFVDLFATQPAKIFGLYPRKGAVVPGADADIVVFDPHATDVISAKTHHHRCDRSIFEGFKVKGKPSHVIVDGRVQFKDGKLDVQRGAGRYLPRQIHTFPQPVRS
ncbi:dihydropyrimidinase [Chondromyces apiculatus]|uniref:Dihydropyrimidinase n=1 Tax=Chondromyces apiculatus DSM 436 TaxID=1192034 RepID=A0A017SWN2_9BACT|nr:dihydropyrimidinase [Chondromyces apiculatus]EYF01162.1 Dihydropyrimidinase [Chondromyces apiculatus DSM 436]